MSACADSSSSISENDIETSQVSEPAETESVEVIEEFEFRGHKFWDSLEQVIEKEGEPDRDLQHEEEYAYTIIYDDVEIFGYQAELSYTFLDEELYMVWVRIYEFEEGSTREERYEDIKYKLSEFYKEKVDDLTAGADDGYLRGIWANMDSRYTMSIFSNDERLTFSMRAFTS